MTVTELDASRWLAFRSRRAQTRRGLRFYTRRLAASAALLLVTAAAVVMSGCAQHDGTTLKFWTFGPEGEVVGGMLAGIRACASGCARRRAADSAHRDAREAADRVRGRCAARPVPARQHLDSGVRRARRARAAAAVCRRVESRARRRLLPRHLGHERRRRRALWRALVRRHAARCSIARTCSRRRGSRRRRARGRSGPARWRQSRRCAATTGTRSSCRSTNSSRCSISRSSRAIRCCATTTRAAISRVPDFAARSRSTSKRFAAAGRRR